MAVKPYKTKIFRHLPFSHLAAEESAACATQLAIAEVTGAIRSGRIATVEDAMACLAAYFAAGLVYAVTELTPEVDRNVEFNRAMQWTDFYLDRAARDLSSDATCRRVEAAALRMASQMGVPAPGKAN